MRYRWPKKEIKRAVQVVILNEHNQVLAVSRKTDHKDFGLPGGKVDPTDKTPEEAIIREVKEETGLDISFLELIFAMHRWGFMGYTYTAKYCGEINTTEPHVVKWANYDEVLKGSFGKWNKMVLDSLRDMGVKIKIHPDPIEEWLYCVSESNSNAGEYEVSFCHRKFHDKHDHFPEEFSEKEWKEISNLLDNGGIEIYELQENTYSLYRDKGKYKTQLNTPEEIDAAMIEAGFIKDEAFYKRYSRTWSKEEL